jgi:hypothetical protein
MRIYVLPCDGIGPEIIDASMISLEALNKKHELGLTFDFDEIGFVSLKKYGTTLRDEVLEKVERYCPSEEPYRVRTTLEQPAAVGVPGSPQLNTQAERRSASLPWSN